MGKKVYGKHLLHYSDLNYLFVKPVDGPININTQTLMIMITVVFGEFI